MKNISKFSKIIKFISRKKKKKNLTQKEAFFLLHSIINKNISDIELGSILIAMRIKGETIEEILGFLKAIKNSFKKIKLTNIKKYSPIIIPSYNGTIKNINFIPLIALLLARKNIPVFIHGITSNLNNKITTFEILKKFNINPIKNLKDINLFIKNKNIVFLPIKILLPSINNLLKIKNFLNIRNFSNFLVKIIQPFSNPSLRLVSYSHLYYFNILSKIFTNFTSKKEGGIFLIKSTEGETMVNIKKIKKINWFFLGKNEIIYDKNYKILSNISLFKKNNINNTYYLTKEILKGNIEIPFLIKKQVQICINMSRMINNY